MEASAARRQARLRHQRPISGRASSPGRRRPRFALLVGLGAAAALLIVATALFGGVEFAAAGKSKCRYSHRTPHHVSPRHARHAIVCLIGKMRRHHGRHALRVRGSLSKAGSRHSGYMRRHRCFSHQCPGEGSLVARIERTRYLPCGCTWGVGENIARGHGRRATPAAIVKQWMHSPPHRSEILSRRLHDVGVGVAWGRPGHRHSRVGTYTADFGFRRG
jgi:hypothetical protein